MSDIADKIERDRIARQGREIRVAFDVAFEDMLTKISDIADRKDWTNAEVSAALAPLPDICDMWNDWIEED